MAQPHEDLQGQAAEPATGPSAAPAAGAGIGRRELLAGGGGFAAGLGLGALLAGIGLVPGQSKAAQAAEAPPWPWPYHRLDPQVVARRAHEGFYQGACCYAVASSLIGELRDQAGYPYTLVPVDMFRYGEGGVVGWASLCGAINGGCAVITLVSGKETYGKVANELVGWYTEAAFPRYRPEGGQELPTSVSGSPLCHVSVTNWCKASGYGAESKERAERCARLCADVAAKTAELLNAQLDGQFAATFKTAASVGTCMSCHGKEAMNNTRGKMDCVQCHEPHD